MEFVKLTAAESRQRKEIVEKIDKLIVTSKMKGYTPLVIAHILSTGYQTLKELSDRSLERSIKSVYEKAAAAEKEGHFLIMTADFQEALMRTAALLCKNFELFDIMSFARCYFVF